MQFITILAPAQAPQYLGVKSGDFCFYSTIKEKVSGFLWCLMLNISWLKAARVRPSVMHSKCHLPAQRSVSGRPCCHCGWGRRSGCLDRERCLLSDLVLGTVTFGPEEEDNTATVLKQSETIKGCE